MKIRTLFITCIYLLMSFFFSLHAEEMNVPTDTIYVYLSQDRLDVYPSQFIRNYKQTSKRVRLTTIDGEEHVYRLSLIDSVSTCPPDSLPRFTSFKFNNKFNSQVFTDAQADIIGDSLITVSVAGIGKYLTPSFQLSDSLAAVYVDGVRQYSKVTRRSFKEPLYYTVTRPGWQIIGHAPKTENETREDTGLVWQPFGHTYFVSVDWPTDRSVMVPAIYIDTEYGDNVVSKDYYLNAYISIDGAGVYPDMEETPVQIKGRGNSSWSTPSYYNNPKNPYRLKFEEKVKPFGMTKGKSWVLQANRQTGSMMTNPIGMRAGHLMGAVATNHVVPVELYLNGDYRGSYIFNEKIGFANNSIDIEDESAAVRLELDSYNESGQFRTRYYSLPVNIKEPDFYDETTETTLTREDIVADVNAFTEAVYRQNDISAWVDVEYLTAFLSVNELIINYELNHPKSTFLFREDLFGDSKYIFGPIWDLDWAYGYEGTGSYYSSGVSDNFYTRPAHTWSGTDRFWKNLRYSTEGVDYEYYKLWTKFMTQGGLDELLDFCDEYYEYANPSFLHNAQRWGDGNNYSKSKENAKNWLRKRANYIYSKLTPYDLTGDLLVPEIWGASASTIDNDDEEDPDDAVRSLRDRRAPTLFTVYDLRGVLLKRGATFDTWRDGLAPGLYIVNGKKVLVP